MESMLHLQMKRDKALATTTPFKIDDSFYVNNKLGEDKNKFFCWDLTKGFLLINMAIEKMAKVEEL